MHKKIISILSVAAISVMGFSMPVSAKKTELLNLDFEDVTFEEFKNSEGVTIYAGIAGDELSIETENASTGNKAFKIFRKAENVADADNKNGSNVNLGFKVMIPEKIDTGVVRVSFRVRTADGYSFRSRWKALGSAINSENKVNVENVTHSTYAYSHGTKNALGNMNSNNWYTISYDVYVEEGMIVKGFNKEPSGDKLSCYGGDFKGLDFAVAYTNQWWTSCNSGDLCYWVDDIKVSVEKLAVVSQSIDDGAENISPDAPVTVTFDSAVNASNNDFNPIFLVCSTSFNPNFAITLFSSTNGTISEIVPTHTISKYFRYSFSSNFNS